MTSDDNTQKMLRAILNSQSSVRSDLLLEIKKVSKKVGSLEENTKIGFKELKEEIAENRRRIDKLGLDLVALSDDSPAMEEFEVLEQRVEKLEHQVVTA